MRRLAEEAAAAEHLRLTFICPHEVISVDRPVHMVSVPGATGDFGILAQHVPTVSALRPGLLTVDTEDGQEEKYFVSGGFVFVHSDSTCSINAVEAIPVEELDAEKIRAGKSKAEQDISSASDELERIKAEIAFEVYDAAESAL